MFADAGIKTDNSNHATVANRPAVTGSTRHSPSMILDESEITEFAFAQAGLDIPAEGRMF